MNPNNLSALLARVRERRPLVHHITNYVTVNDCANVTLCAGGSPVMAHAPEEVEEMVALSGALVLNIGTLAPDQIEAMLRAGAEANRRNIPIVLDPVGVGATTLRTASARRLLDELDIRILKGNAGEIGVLAGAEARVRGVDSAGVAGDVAAIAREFAARERLVVVVSGPVDVVSDGQRTLFVENGHVMMESISGAGCMLASVTGVFAAVGASTLVAETPDTQSDDPFFAAVAACAAFGLAGERAAEKASGPYSFKTALFDELARLTPDALARGARIRPPRHQDTKK